MNESTPRLRKRPTGIPGLDGMTHGGLPAAGVTLVLGQAGCGKTVLGLQIIAHAVAEGHGGVLVSFEESAQQLQRDAASFQWGEALIGSPRFSIVEAQPHPGAESGGSFDVEGLLSVLEHYVGEHGARWIVLDGIDQLLRFERDTELAVAQMAAVNRWCEARECSLLITGKHADTDHERPEGLEGMEFLLSTVLVLTSHLVHQRLIRRIRVGKYRGTGHVRDSLALLIDDEGLHVPYGEPLFGGDSGEHAPEASLERVSTGVPRLDEVLDGGFYRGSTTLLSGQPGTAKTTLAAVFAHAAAERGERVLFISFDEYRGQIVRNVGSVGVHLQPHIEAGRLALATREAWNASAEEHYLALKRQLVAMDPHCLVIDPVSALLKASVDEGAFLAIERVVTETRRRGITTLITSLSASDDPLAESSLSHTSTLADTWLMLRYQIHGGERNRSLSVVKSRGTPHSSQVRELIMTPDGVDLADVYPYGTEVLMGTARLHKENEEARERQRQEAERAQRQRDLERHIEQADTRMREAQRERERLQEELEAERAATRTSDDEVARHRADIVHRRQRGRDGDTS